jgi:adenylate cyclase
MYVATYIVLLLLFVAYARLHPALSAALTLAVAGAYVLLAAQLVFPADPDWFLFDNIRYLLPTVQLPIGAALLYVGNLVFHLVAERRAKRKVTDTFKKYVDPAIINDIMETGLDNLALGGRL